MENKVDISMKGLCIFLK